MFWRNRFLKNFGNFPLKYKPENRSWKDHYIQTFINLQKFKENPTKFLDYIMWHTNIKSSLFLPDGKNGHQRQPLEQAPEWVLANLWLLDLGKIVVQSEYFSTSNMVFDRVTPYQLYQKLRYHSLPTELRLKDGIFYPGYGPIYHNVFF